MRSSGFFSQCERKHNYFVHGLIRLQVQQAFVCIMKLCLINTFLHAISKSCMNGCVCVCMHAYTHLAFKELIDLVRATCNEFWYLGAVDT